MRQQLSLTFLILLLAAALYGQTPNDDRKIEHLKTVQSGQFLEIDYTLSSPHSDDNFYVWIEIEDSLGNKIQVKTHTGDVGVMTAGKKSVRWHIHKDLPEYIGTIDLSVHAKEVPKHSKEPVSISKNLLFPGNGRTPKKTWQGLVTYGAVGTAIISGVLAHSNYSKYKASENPEDIDSYFGKANMFKTVTFITAGAALTTWGLSNLSALKVKNSPEKKYNPEEIKQDNGLKHISESVNNIYVATKYEQTILPPDLMVELNYYDENDNNILEALETFMLELKITNKGGGKAQGIAVIVTDEDNDEDLQISKPQFKPVLKPGESQTATVEIFAKQTMRAKTHRINIQVDEYSGYGFNGHFDLESYKYTEPEMVFSGIEIVEEGLYTQIRNKDGKIENNEQVVIKISLQNVKTGLAHNVKYEVISQNPNVKILNSKGKSTIKGNLGTVKGGDLSHFSFLLSPNMYVRADGNPLPIYLSVSEGVQGEQIKHFQIPVYLNKQAKDPVVAQIKSDYDGFRREIDVVSNEKNKIIKANFGEIHDIRNVKKSQIKRPNSIGIIMGVSQYRYMPPAPYADNDADVMELYFRDVLGIENTYVYKNKEVTGDFFKTMFDPEYGELKAGILKGETELFVFYSGHGVPDKDGENIYLFPSNGRYEQLPLFGYNINTFYENLDKLGAKSVTVFTDACFSGSSRVSETYAAANLTGNKSGIIIKPITKKPWDDNPNYTVFNSSSFEQTSLGFEESNTGLFTYYLCAGLSGRADANQDSTITLGELGKYVKTNVSESSKKISGEQNPQLNGNKNMILTEY